MLWFVDNHGEDKDLPYVVFDSTRNNKIIAKIADNIALINVIYMADGYEPGDVFDINLHRYEGKWVIKDNRVIPKLSLK